MKQKNIFRYPPFKTVLSTVTGKAHPVTLPTAIAVTAVVKLPHAYRIKYEEMYAPEVYIDLCLIDN